ncbi:MAG: radical SAM protein [Burkholderiales bacterium]|nr:radical SAM protein [Burkholderiales bacterium]
MNAVLETQDTVQFSPLPDAFERVDLIEALPLPNPISMLVDPTSLCNFRCQFCPTGDPHLIKQSGRSQNFMPLELLQRILDGVREFEQPLKVLRLYKDGEPLLNPHFAEFVRQAKAVPQVQRVETTTNGSKLDRAMARRLMDAGIDRIVISIEGVSAQKYLEFAKVRIDFDALVENIAYLHSIRGQCQIHVKTVQENLGEGEDAVFRELFGPICDRLFIERTVPSWPTFNIDRLVRRESRELDAQHRPLVRKRVCAYPFYSLSVNSDGTVSPCCVDWRRDLVLGDVRRERLLDIWNGAALAELRRTHIERGRAGNPTCASCGQVDYCATENLDGAEGRLRKAFGATA